MPPKKTRKTYDFGYKLGAVKRAEEIGNRATARELEVDESMIRNEWEKWMTKGMHTYTNTGKMKKATLTEVCNWVIRSWNAVEVSTITNGFKKAGITTQGESESEPEDEEEDAEDARLDPVADARLLELFNSDTEDEDFDGF